MRGQPRMWVRPPNEQGRPKVTGDQHNRNGREPDLSNSRRKIDRLDRDLAALVVIDAQNDFCHEDGLSARQGSDVSRVREPLERLGALISAARTYDVPVYFIQNLHTAESDTREWLERHAGLNREQNCQVGSWGAEFCGVQPEEGDRVVTKRRYSAFINTSLENDLRAHDRSSLLFAGFTTGACVESSLRDAVCLDFAATLVDDCCGAYIAASHDRAVESVRSGFGVVRSGEDIIRHWAEAYGDQKNTLTAKRVGS